MHAWILWAVITLLALLIEVLTLGFAVICFAIGALAACIVAFFGLNFTMQLATFSVVTIVTLVLVRPFVIRFLTRSKTERIETNANALIGRRAIVTQNICNGTGRVSIDGDDWKAMINDENSVIPIGEKVEIVCVDSVILIVKRIK